MDHKQYDQSVALIDSITKKHRMEVNRLHAHYADQFKLVIQLMLEKQSFINELLNKIEAYSVICPMTAETSTGAGAHIEVFQTTEHSDSTADK